MRADGSRLVVTNGCFDLLHVGHVRYLEEARSLGDVLVVAINGDASARELKGPGRPLNSELERAEVVASLRCVSAVTIFEEDTALELVHALKPDVYVKGGDYSDDPADAAYPPEAHAVTRDGGTVAIVALTPGRSTTRLLEQITEGRADRQ
jgi:rfaE bifunctional protein nucleotidyltransferase chain/domain